MTEASQPPLHAVPAVAIVDSRGRVCAWNVSAERLSGWSASEITSRPFPLVSAEGTDTARETVWAGLASMSPDGFPLVLRLRGGGTIPVHAWASPLPGTDRHTVVFLPAERPLAMPNTGAGTALREPSEDVRTDEERFATALKASPNALVVSRVSDGTIQEVNDAFLELFGYSRDEVMGRTSLSLGMFADPRQREMAIDRLLTLGRVRDFEVRIRLRSGEEREASLTIEPMQAGGDAVMVTVIRDVTERHQAEKRYARLFSAVREGFAHYKAIYQDGKLVDLRLGEINPAGAEFAGTPREEQIGKTCRQVFPAINEAMLALYQRVDETGETVRFDVDNPLIGKTYDVAITRVASGEFAVTFNDITERKRITEAAQASRAKLEAALEAMTDAVLISDAEGRFVDFNEAFATVHRFRGKEECARTFDEYPDILDVYFSNGDLAPVEQWAVPRALRGETGTNEEYILRRKDTGETWTGSYSFAPIRDSDGRIVGSVVAGRDITETKRAGAALRESSALLQAISDSTGDVIFAKDRGGRLTFANPATLALVGKPLDQVLGRTDAESLEDKDAARVVMENDRRIMDTGVAEDLEEMVPLPDGTRRVWFSRKMPYRDTDGKVIGLLGVSRDITERKATEEALRLSEDKFNKAFAANPAAMALTRVEDGRFIEVNETWMSVMGYRREEAIGKSSREMHIWPGASDRERFVDELRRTGRLQEWEQHFQRKSGETFIALLSAEVLDVHGEKLVLSTFVDITYRKRAEEALRESEERFRTLADNMSQLAWMADPSGWIFWYNQRWFGYTGTTLEEMQGWGWEKVHHPDHLESVVDRWNSFLRAGEPWEDTFPLMGADGQYRWFLSRAFPIRDESGAIVRWFGTNTDITERLQLEEVLRRQAEALAQADRAKDEFLAMLAHELRNPLGAIGNAAALIEMQADGNTRLGRPVDILNRQVKHTARLVDDLLDVSRITRGKLDLRKELLDLATVLRRAVDIVRPQMDVNRHEFTVSIPDDPFWLEGDAARLEQVAGNLLNNAAKYTDAGGHVSLSLRSEGGEAVIRVRDDGQGITPDIMPRIFDLFVQEDRSLARTKGGLGIGLTLVKRLVEMHGGSVEARSDGPDQGSEFVVRLPLWDDPAAPSDSSSESEGAEVSRRILLVEDNVDAAITLAEILEAWGHKVYVAHDGPTALEAAAQQAPEIVLLDIGLPVMDGYEVARALRNTKTTAAVRIVALTGYGQDADQERARRAGFDHHVVKPVDMKKLRDVLAKHPV